MVTHYSPRNMKCQASSVGPEWMQSTSTGGLVSTGPYEIVRPTLNANQDRHRCERTEAEFSAARETLATRDTMEERGSKDMTNANTRRFGWIDERIKQGVVNGNGRPAHTGAG